MKKKLFVFLLSVVMVMGLVLTGCGGGDTNKDTNSEDKKEAQNDDEGKTKSAEKIIVFQSKVEIVDKLEELAGDYQDETGVEVEVWGTTGDDYFQQLKTKLANNQGPTVFSLAPGAESEQMASYLADLSDLSFVDQIAEGMANEKDGKVIGIPYTVEGFGMVYNKNLFDASKVTNTDEFVKMLEEQKGNSINGLGLSKESYFLIGHMLNTPFALQENPTEFVEKLGKGEVKMADTKEFQEFAKMYAAIRENSYNPLEVNYDKEIGDFATGKTAAIHQGNWCYNMFEDYDLDFELGMAALPINGNDKLSVSVPTAWYVNSQASEEEQQAGKDFLNWLYTSDKGKEYLMDEFGFIPVVEGMESENMDPLSQEVAKYTEEGKTITWPMNQWPAGIVDVYLVPVAEKFFTTDMSEQDFLKALDEAWAEAAKK